MAERIQTSEARTFAVFLRDSLGAPASGLTPTGTARYKDGTAGAPAVTMTEVGGGFYRVELASPATKDVLVVVDGGSSLSSTRYVALEIPVGGYVDQVDATTSSRASQSSVTALGGPAQAADWTPARAAKVDNLDAAVSTRATHAEATADSAGVTTLLGRLDATRASLLDLLSLLDAAVSTRATPADVAARPVVEVS